MRSLPVVVFVLGTSLSAWSQGTIFFANRIAPYVAPVFGVDETAPISGTGFFAQLFAGAQNTGENALTPVGSPVTFRTGGLAGTWAGVQEVIPGVAGGAIATLQVRVWDNAGGTLNTYTAALSVGRTTLKSVLFDSLPLGNNAVTPPTLPPNIVGNPNPMNNLSSFSLVPEPSAMALGALCAVALLLRRRRAQETMLANQKRS